MAKKPQWLKGIFPKVKRKEPDSKFKAEMERITDHLIDETVGVDGLITREFNERMAGYDPDVNPISPKEAEALIHSLLRTAVAQRKCLTERIAASVESGELYEKYYSKVHLISDSAVDAYTKMQLWDHARDEYEYYYEMYLKTRKKAYDDDVKPDPKGPKPPKPKDILEAIDQAEGGLP